MSFSSSPTSQPSGRKPVLTDPVRHPENATSPARTKRAWLLLLMTLVLPGSAQVVAGNRRFGRRALAVTFLIWALIICTVVLALVNQELFITLGTSPVWSVLAIVVLVALAIWWAVLFISTLRIVRPVLLAPGMRAIFTGALAVVMVVCCGSLGYLAYSVNSGRNAVNAIFSSGPDMKPVDGRYNFLVIGGDAGEDREGRRPDSIIVLSVDAATGKAVTISIPRNLQNAQFPESSPMHKIYPQGYNCGDNCIINFLYGEVTQKYANLYPNAKDPGAEALKDAASGTLGITVQGYLLIDMDGFAQMIDALGGVKINAGGWVPISGANIPGTDQHRPPEGWIAPGVQSLNGQQALWYARSREYVTDYARSQRQQCIQQAILKEMSPTTVLSKFNQIADAGTKLIESNIPQNQLGSFIGLVTKAKKFPLDRLTLGPPDYDRDFPTYPDFQQIHQRVQQLIKGTAPENADDSGKTPENNGGTPPPSSSNSGASGNTANPGNGQNSGAGQGSNPNTNQGDAGQQSQTPQVTEQYLQQLAINGQTAELTALLSNNGNCTPA